MTSPAPDADTLQSQLMEAEHLIGVLRNRCTALNLEACRRGVQAQELEHQVTELRGRIDALESAASVPSDAT